MNNSRVHIRHLSGYADWSQAIIADALQLLARYEEGIPHAAVAPKPFSIAFAGGKTPIPLYRQLAQVLVERNAAKLLNNTAPLPLQGFAGDERHTPDQPHWRNGQMLRDAFSELVAKQLLQLLEWPIENSAEEACTVMAEKLGLLASNRNDTGFGLGLCYLGLGADGHTAGIFGQPLMVTTNGLCGLYRAPDYPHERLSLTPQAILRAKNLRLLVTKSGKEAALADLTAETPVTTAGKLLQHYLTGNPAADCIVFLCS